KVAGLRLSAEDVRKPERLQQALLPLIAPLALISVQSAEATLRRTFEAELSFWLEKEGNHLALGLEKMHRQLHRKQSVRAIWFVAPVQQATGERAFSPAVSYEVNDWLILPQLLSVAKKSNKPRLHWGVFEWGCMAVNALLLLLVIAMLISWQGNLRLVKEAKALNRAVLSAKPGTQYSLRSTLALQRKLEKLEYQEKHGAPWHLRMGLSRQPEILQALFEAYQKVAYENIALPVQSELSLRLHALAGLSAEQQDDNHAKAGYDQLKAYLMLANPGKAEAAFLTKLLPEFFHSSQPVPEGLWADLSGQLLPFYINRLNAHPEWAVPADVDLVNRARQTLLNQIGLKNAEDSLYQELVTEANAKYASVSLPALLAGRDARGLFGSKQSVPGAYTRQAWEGYVEKNMQRISEERGVQVDWVLADGDSGRPAKKDPKALHAQLRARYFAEFAAAWTGFLNSIQWTPANTIPGSIEQLSQLADMQQSPLVALMNSVQYQGQTAKPVAQMADALVNKAKNLLNSEPAIQGAVIPKGPLDDAFGPLLALMSAEAGSSGDAELSLSRYLTRVTSIRLKLQQIMANPAPETLARSLAQAVLQGKVSDFVDARNYASLVAASTGAQWGTFAQALFNQPLDQAWQTVLTPAARSINESWQTSVVLPWRSSFEARYPFKNVNDDASFPELGRFLQPDGGLIDHFVNTQLNGVLVKQGDQWEPNQLAPQGLTFNVDFLNALNQLGRLSSRLFVEGNAGYRFDLQPQMGKGVVRTDLQIDNTELTYLNQPTGWHEVVWPGNDPLPGVQLSWISQKAGLKVYLKSKGRWSFLRLLEKAKVKQIDSARYWLTWQASDGEPVNYLMRTQAGQGPLELLQLRQFKMPQSVFVVKGEKPAVAKVVVQAKGKK
ncbi:MAG: ImcF-related family protein, partial [Iodobacter sp.]